MLVTRIDALLRALVVRGVGARTHSGASLYEHLRGTAHILLAWECDAYVCLAGACHSVYGTEAYRRATLEMHDRAWLRDEVGDEAERLAWLFGVHVRASLWDNFFTGVSVFAVTDRFTGAPAAVTRRERDDLLTLTAANWIEQLPRVPVAMRDLGREELFALVDLLPPRARADLVRAYAPASPTPRG